MQKNSPSTSTLSWQERMQNVSQRDLYIWKHEMWTDCAFIVGTEEKEFLCHRLQLAKSSPVFAAMLYGDLYQPGQAIRVSDIETAGFTALLQYIYEGQAEIDSFSGACSLLIAAKKYMLPPSMQEDCRSFIWSNMYPHNVWTALQFALDNFEQELYETAVELIQRRGTFSFALADFVRISHHTLLTFLRLHGNVQITKEADIVTACLRWARNQLDIQNLEESPTTLRQVLGDVLEHLDFRDMETEDLMTSGLFLQEEIEAILNCEPKIAIPLPDKFSNDVCLRKPPDYDSFYIFGRNADYELKNDTYDLFTTIEFPVVVDKLTMFKIIGIQFPTQVRDNDGYDDCYEEDLSIVVHEGNNVLGVSRFRSFVQYNSSVNIELVREIVVESRQNITVKIIAHVSGRYPHVYTAPTNFAIHRKFFKGYYNAIYLKIPQSLICPILLE